MMKILTEQAQALGVSIHLESPVKKILKKEAQIVGVQAQDNKGGIIECRAGAVVIATGGFGNNPEMIQSYTGFEVNKDIYPFQVPGITGDGIRMAWEAGAQKTEMSMELVYGMPDPMSVPPSLHEACRQPHLLVNYLGERFMNEDVMANVTFTGNAISLQKKKTAFLIFDDRLLKLMEQDFDTRNRVFPATCFAGSESVIAEYLRAGKGNFYVADSIEELCEQTGIELAGLHETIATYNTYCDQGYDKQFNKNRAYLRPLRGQKWYAGRHFPSAYGSAGGIKINERAEVIGQDWHPIKGLYAAGTDACSIYGDSYPFLFPGTSMGFALNTGRLAAESIQQYLKEVE